jgi:hypothetical protein
MPKWYNLIAHFPFVFSIKIPSRFKLENQNKHRRVVRLHVDFRVRVSVRRWQENLQLQTVKVTWPQIMTATGGSSANV